MKASSHGEVVGHRPAIWFISIGVIAGIALGARAALLSATAEWNNLRSADAGDLYLPRPSALRLLSLGHHEMLADLAAARANVYFGSQLAAHGEQIGLERALATAVELDPQFHHLYPRAAAMLVYDGRPLSVDSVLAANRILSLGALSFPGDWELPFQHGFNLLFELPKLAGDGDPRVPGWRQEGVESLRRATQLEGAPPWLANLAALASPPPPPPPSTRTLPVR